MNVCLKWGVALLAVTGTLPCASYGQALGGDLVGSVLDLSGAGIPNAAVEAHNIATGVDVRAKATGSGQYRLNNLSLGLYTLTASAGGFTAASIQNLKVEANKTLTSNVTLQVGKVSTTVDVTEAASVIDTTTAAIANSHDSRQAQDLPISSLGFGVLNLSLLNSGVASNGGIGAGQGPSVGGQRPRNNNFQVEGVDNNDHSVTGPLILVPNDAVGEFTVQQNQFSAEFGHSSGGQFNTLIRSGANVLHGTLYEYLQNRNLNAMDQAFVNQNGLKSNPRSDQSRLGAAIGGPVIKNKLFYFGGFEYNPDGETRAPGQLLTPTADGYAKLAGISTLNQTNLNVLKQYLRAAPVPHHNIQVAGVAIPVGVLPLTPAFYQDGYYGVASADYNVSDKDQLRARYVYNRVNQLDPSAALREFYQLKGARYHLFTLAEYHNFSPSITNEFRLGYHRYRFNTPDGGFAFPALDSFPNLQFTDLGGLQVGPNPNSPQHSVQNLYQGTDNVTVVTGKHTVQLGGDFRKAIAPTSFTQRSRGDYQYRKLDTYLRDITPDKLAQRGLGHVVFYGDQIASYSYLSDVWRIRPNFTLNLGLRHEYTRVPFSEGAQRLNAISNVPGLLIFDKPKAQKKNFAPRIGVAYSPGNQGTTSIRAGFGIAYDVLYDSIGTLSVPPQFGTTVDVTNAGQANFLRNGGILPSANGVILTAAQAERRLRPTFPIKSFRTPSTGISECSTSSRRTTPLKPVTWERGAFTWLCRSASTRSRP